ncbi:MAG: energy-dependent translational throttle protein EttA [Acidimicrobiia bacterium]|nr:energy-dependent translational throttle protein EttA [Acidimicrobiia bacterium]NND14646.1 energy-dependent translational throttle protein EttA [Acidimicrobiia bacterium]
MVCSLLDVHIRAFKRTRNRLLSEGVGGGPPANRSCSHPTDGRRLACRLVSAQYIYTMHKLGRFYPPDRDVLKDINLSFFPGAKIGVLGPNGAGKSSLLKIMAGRDDGFTGDARLTPGFSVGLLEQEPQLDPNKDVQGNVMDGVGEVAALLVEYEEVLAGWADPEADYEKLGERQADVEAKIESAKAWDLQRNIEIAMDALRLPPGDADVTALSGGERRRVALCRLLLSRPDLLLLDEPTNHLDAESVAWLERFLKDYEGTVVAITHDRYFLDNVAGWILELDRGRGIPFEGNYSSWLEQKQARLDSEDRKDRARAATLKRELEWVRMSPKARQSKGKARLNSYEELLAESKAADGRINKLEISIPANQRLGDVVIVAEHVRKGFGEKLLIEDLSFILPPAGIVGVIGANGAGKTTLFRMIVDAYQNAGSEQPDNGTLTVGPTVELAYVDQSRDTLDGSKTVFEEITGGAEHVNLGGREMHSRAYVAGFNFKGSDQQKKVGELSGGERNRVHLAKVLKSGGNVLLLDEPTNDLDVDTLRALEDGLENYAGCAVIISHDRWFLDRVATHVLAFEGDSQVRWFEGNFTEYADFMKRELGAEAMRPHRISYKPLVR